MSPAASAGGGAPRHDDRTAYRSSERDCNCQGHLSRSCVKPRTLARSTSDGPSPAQQETPSSWQRTPRSPGCLRVRLGFRLELLQQLALPAGQMLRRLHFAWITMSPRAALRSIEKPRPRKRNCAPAWVPAGMRTFCVLPSIAGTSISSPSAAWAQPQRHLAEDVRAFTVEQIVLPDRHLHVQVAVRRPPDRPPRPRPAAGCGCRPPPRRHGHPAASVPAARCQRRGKPGTVSG